MHRLIQRLRDAEPRLEVGDLFPPLERELVGYEQLFEGEVLNAGAGHRDISHVLPGRLTNQDIETGLHNANIDVFSPLHEIPFEDGHFDAIICNAVLEHVQNPREVVAEFHRVLRPGGVLYLCVPFMQPEHLDPTDFQRYTSDGLATLARDHGFEVREVTGVHSVYSTLGWIFIEWLRPFPGWKGWLLRWLTYPVLKRKALTSTNHVHSLASSYRLVAVRS